ncbi:MAG: DnaA/Hda family protein [Planctomycetota bacterium]
MATRQDGINSRIADRLARSVGQRRYELWIEPSVRLDYRDHDHTLRVAVPNRFVADKVRRDFSEELQQATRAEAGLDDVGELRLDLCVEPDRFARPDNYGQTGETQDVSAERPVDADVRRLHQAAPRQATTKTAERPAPANTFRHRFEDYVVGPCNELAFAASVALANADPDDENPASHGPLFLHGDCGVGKTHLLLSACRRVRERQPQARVHYTTGEQFTNDYITAVRGNTLDAFRRKMRRLDLLAIDDIGFFANKEKTQQEFLHCFDHIELSGSRVMLASDSHPKLIKKFSDALVSRCMQGLVVQLQTPDPATRRTLVQRFAGRRGLVLQPQIDELIAAHAGDSVREIEGSVVHLHALASLAQPQGPTRTVSRALAEKLFAGQQQLVAQRPVRFTDIQDTVCGHLNVPAAQVAGSSRHRVVVLARAITVYLAKQMTTLSYPEIAAALNKDSHSTVVTAVQRMTRQLQDNQPMLLPGQPDETTPVQLVEDLKRRVLESIAA